MLNKTLFKTSAIILLGSTFAMAQPKWKPITQQTKPWTRWWWEGNAVNPKDLTYNMEAYQKVGLGGLEITPIYGVKGAEAQFIDFLSPKWVDMFKHTLKEGSRLGLGIDLANASGWPFGGRWVTPEDACKAVFHKTYSLKEGETLNENINFVQPPLLRYVLPKSTEISALKYPISKNDNLQELAIDQVRFERPIPLQTLMAYSDKGEALNLTDKVNKEGKLSWQAPAGNWTLYAVFQGFHGKMVERAGPGGEGDVIDHFSDKAIKNYLSAFDKAFAKADVSGMRAFFNDSYEVDDARGQSDWTDNLFNEFKTRRGYELRNYLPNLFSKENTDLNRRVLFDYRTTIGDLILEKYTSEWAKWAHARGKIVRNQAHGSPANTLDLYSVVDIPEIEGTDLLRIKFASSAANVMGKKLASSESATWENEHFLSNLADVKRALDLFMVGGINHIFYHGTSYSPKDAQYPGWLFYAAVHFMPNNPFWKDFGTLNNYVARCQSFLQNSKGNNDILFYFPITDRLTEHSPKGLLEHFDGVTPEFNGTDFKEVGQKLLDRGYGFDFISDRQILNLQAQNQQILTGGIKYKTILMAESEQIPLETFEKLVSLAKEGATIIFHKKLPVDVPGLGNLAQRQTKFKALLSEMNFVENSANFKQASVGKGTILVGENLDAMMNTAKIWRETMIDEGLQFVRKTYDKGYYYFINNKTNKAFDGWVKLTVSAKSAALYNPMTGALGMAKYNATTNEIYLQLAAGESCIIETYNTPVQSSNFAYYKSAAEPQELKGTWKLSFLEGGPTLPKTIEIQSLGSWTKLDGDAYKNFSGTAAYTLDFSKPSSTNITAGYWLDLGKVAESASVILNGQNLGTLIGPSYKVFVPKTLFKEQNTLTVQVSNSMANRVIAIEKEGQVWQKFYNINISARLRPNLGKNGYFTTLNWQPRDSGLLDKVTLIAVEKK
ncbi:MULTISPECIES: glycosyl hydrolase [Emticicia]|uniref:glycosyl hydrolase n=1 Tax=Emticicia TaxID=312278 RepID=UPI0007D8B1DB|nr:MULTISPECIES: glycosyl hydrolase [Emticicia]